MLVLLTLLFTTPSLAAPTAIKPAPIVQRCERDVDNDRVSEQVLLTLKPNGRAMLLVIDSDAVTVLYRGKPTLRPSLRCGPPLELSVGGRPTTYTWQGGRFVVAGPMGADAPVRQGGVRPRGR